MRSFGRSFAVNLVATFVAASAALSGCGKKDEPHRKPTFPVTGQVVVDGKSPGEAIKIECHPVGGMDQEHPSVSQTMTAPDGKFEIATYETGDGVPQGEYVLTFMWGKMNLISMSYGGPDKLNNRYSDPKQSEFKFKVEDKPVDLGRIELTTK
jgi:hypothetical protein